MRREDFERQYPFFTALVHQADARAAAREEVPDMALGPGKYDELCTDVRTRAKARGAIVIVFDGANGSGFSAQLPPEETFRIAAVLRNMADQIEQTGPLAP